MLLALREMHKIGWVHRDVSAGNILVRDDGDPLLGDLKFAKIMDEGEETRVVRPLSDFRLFVIISE